MIWFSSDHHFGHKNILEYTERKHYFKDIEEMDRILIDNWNKLVKKEDTVYYLGDFTFKNPDEYISKLNGKIKFIKGSHDKYDAPYMRIIKPGILDEYGNLRTIVLCHYAMRSWDKSHYASFCLWGHHHGKLEPYGLSFDVGVDCWDYKPVSLKQVEEKMKTLKPIVDFRNKTEIL